MKSLLFGICVIPRATYVLLSCVTVISGEAVAGDACEESSLLQASDVYSLGQANSPPELNDFLRSVSSQMQLPQSGYTASGTHFAQGYTTPAATQTQIYATGMEEDCSNINLNKKLSSDFRADVFGKGVKGFFYKCEKVGYRNLMTCEKCWKGVKGFFYKYWFTITSASKSDMNKLCDPSTVYPTVYDPQHNTYWQDLPFTCDAGPRKDRHGRDFLESVSDQMQLPKHSFTASGTHFAQGYMSQEACDVNPEGMKEDCDNINLNKKLSSNFRSDVFGNGMKGFFYKCEKVAAVNKYWFTITSARKSDMKKLCDPSTAYPIVYDPQHNTYWQDLPFACVEES